MGKLILKLIWFGFGLFGLVTLGQKHWPQISLVKPTMSTWQSANLQSLTPVLQQQAFSVLGAATEQIKALPAQEIEKIKLGVCQKIMDL